MNKNTIFKKYIYLSLFKDMNKIDEWEEYYFYKIMLNITYKNETITFFQHNYLMKILNKKFRQLKLNSSNWKKESEIAKVKFDSLIS